MSFKFIHCGDLHLGCFPNRIEERFNDFFVAFRNLVEYAIEKEIKLILISGDLFHLKVINSKTLQKTIDILELAKTNKIDVLVIEGNHDKAFYIDEDSWLLFLNNQGYIKLLNSTILDGQVILNKYEKSGAIIETDDYRIIGLGYMGGATQKYINDITHIITKKNKFTILMLHASVNRLSGQDMGDISSDDILKLKSKVDYIALGHIHNMYEVDGFCYNPGSLETIRLRDGLTSEKKGFYEVTVNDDLTKEVMHIKSNLRKTSFKSLNVSNFINPEEIEEYIINYDFNVNENEMLEINLYGKIDFNPFLINTNRVIEELKSKWKLLYIEINNNINIIRDINSNSEDADISKIIYNLVKDEIKINNPNIENLDYLAKMMIDVTNMLSEGEDDGLIIDNLLKADIDI